MIETFERFAFTSNNISYAVAGDILDYWGFFPAEPPWGRIPAIGLGTIVESANPDIEVGGRYFGFYPMGSEHIVLAEAYFVDGYSVVLVDNGDSPVLAECVKRVAYI